MQPKKIYYKYLHLLEKVVEEGRRKMNLVGVGYADLGPYLQVDQKLMRFWKTKDRGMVRQTNSLMAPSGKVTFDVAGSNFEVHVRAVLLHIENIFSGEVRS